MINFMRLKMYYFLISLCVILPGLYAIFILGLKPGIDFTGGSILELRFKQEIQTEKKEEIQRAIQENGFSLNSLQTSGDKTYLLRLKPVSKDEIPTIKATIADKLAEMPEELRFETVGPILGKELLSKTFIAIFLAALAILGYVAWAFRELRFGVCAILAMLHDSLVMLGTYTLLGYFFGAEIDTLFVTAMLTTLSFSVHDTVVVYDRIRESQRKFPSLPFIDLANKAVTETMSRSLNNSLTIIFMLVALVFLGGVTVKWFAVALLIGTISGTYSSPFTAVPLLVVWENFKRRAH